MTGDAMALGRCNNEEGESSDHFKESIDHSQKSIDQAKEESSDHSPSATTTTTNSGTTTTTTTNDTTNFNDSDIDTVLIDDLVVRLPVGLRHRLPPQESVPVPLADAHAEPSIAASLSSITPSMSASQLASSPGAADNDAALSSKSTDIDSKSPMASIASSPSVSPPGTLAASKATHPLLPSLRNKHAFVLTTYTRPTYCDYCSQFIWGLVRQGHQCQACGYNAHRRCYKGVSTICHAVRAADAPAAAKKPGRYGHLGNIFGDDDDQDDDVDDIDLGSARSSSSVASSVASSVDLLLHDSAASSLPPSGGDKVHGQSPVSPNLIKTAMSPLLATAPTSAASSPASASASSKKILPLRPLVAHCSSSSPSLLSPPPSHGHVSPAAPNDSTTSLAAELFANVQIEAKKTEKAIKDANPPFGVNAMIKSNNRYVARQGPLIWINETVTALVTWQNPTTTLCFLLGYVIVCSYPVLVLVLPQAVLGYLILRCYFDRAEKLVQGEPMPPAPPLGAPPKITMTNTQYFANLQHIQNTMTNISNMYDAGYHVYQYVNWSHPEETERVAYMLAASVVGVGLLVSVVPLNMIFMVGGVGAFVANTAVVRAASVTLAPVIVGNLQRSVGHFVDRMKPMRSSGAHGATAISTNSTAATTVVTVCVYENQRWWAGLGFIPLLFHGERSTWSDETGQMPVPSKAMYQLPTTTESIQTDVDTGIETRVRTQWQWHDPDWSIDASIVDGIGAGSDGWVYTDNVWGNPSRLPLLSSFTRRRKWVRRMKMAH